MPPIRSDSFPTIDAAAYLRDVVPLEVLLERSLEYGDPDGETVVRRLHEQRDLRIARVAGLVDHAEDGDRDLRASEQREADRLRGEVETIDGVLERATRGPRDPATERARRAHLEASRHLPTAFPGGEVVTRRRPSLELGLSEELVRDVQRAMQGRETIRRSLADVDRFGAFTRPAVPARGRLANYTTVRPTTSANSTFVAMTPAAAAGPVAEEAPKGKIADGALVNVAVQKLAGYVELSLEQALYGVDVGQAVEDVAFRQLITAENARIVAALATATAAGPGTTPALSILAGIASVAAGGGAASVIAVAPADIPAVLGEYSANSGYTVTGEAVSLAPTLWGVPVVPAFGIAAGDAYVWDEAAVGAAVAMPPSLLVDPYSQSVNNKIIIVVDELVGFALIQPAQAAKVNLAAP